MEKSVEPVSSPSKARKKSCNPSRWKKTAQKTARHKPKGLPEYPQCNHTQGMLRCKTLKMKAIKSFHSIFYKFAEREYQNNFLLKYVQISNVKRRRPDQSKKGLEAKVYDRKIRTTRYFVRNSEKENVPVCLKSFVGILGISRFRINNITKEFHNKGFVKENRGGFRKVAEFKLKKECVMNFINKLKCIESHYCRGKSIRNYLSNDLNITKLWKMYLSETDNISVKLSYFRHIFNTNYNLGFNSPQTDMCSLCLCFNEKLKTEKNVDKRTQLLIEKRVHKLRAKKFYEKLKDTDEKLLILSFDCQKNVPIPKLPDQSTYYSRQVYVHNLTVVRGHSKSKLNRDNVTSYCWTENEFSRGSNTIASCVFDSLSTIDLSNYTKIRLISDGCGGQNKNSIFIAMCSYWLSLKGPKHINEIEVVYPVTGHSFLPPDRVFGFIEKEMRKLEVICKREEVYDIISKFATVKILGQDCKVADFKSAMLNVMKPTRSWHFKISKCRRVYIKKTKRGQMIRVRGEVTFTLDHGVYRSLFFPNKNALELNPNVIQQGNCLSQEKKTDVNNLLTKHYGDSWRDLPNLKFFVDVIDCSVVPVTEDDEEDLCECREDDENLII